MQQEIKVSIPIPIPILQCYLIRSYRLTVDLESNQRKINQGWIEIIGLTRRRLRREDRDRRLSLGAQVDGVNFVAIAGLNVDQGVQHGVDRDKGCR